MFEIKCIIGDKKLVAVLTLLDGHTLEPPVVTPVKGAQTSKLNGAAKPEKSNVTSDNLLSRYIVGKKQVTASQLREHCMNNGLGKNAYSYGLRKLLKTGALKKTKTRYLYMAAS